jgi:hypothetical protein
MREIIFFVFPKAILFLKRTLLTDIFYEILTSNQTALSQYSFYLKQVGDEKELSSLEK